MPLARRVARLVTASLLFVAFASAQPAPEVYEAIPNWTAPPFWTPPSAAALERAKDSRALPLESDAIEGLPTSPLPFFGIRPCRVVDTRPSQGFTGAYGPPTLAANATRDFDLNSAPHCPGIPANAEAYSINVTITETAGPGDVRIWPTGNPPVIPVSTQNWPSAGYTLANAAIVPAGTGGSVTVQIAVSNAHLIIDINGYYAPVSIVNTVNGLSGAVALAAGSNISITPSGQTLTIANTAPAAWRLTGNAGTTPGTNFIGTTDNQPLEIKVNGKRVMRFELSLTNDATNVIAGNHSNSVSPDVRGATIAGGGDVSGQNFVTDLFGTVGGGHTNRAGDFSPSAGDASFATVGGGQSNIASGPWATVVGGNSNVASAEYATVLGGNDNTATGSRSVAAGRNALAQHRGTFVWGDDQVGQVASSSINQFVVRASGGIWLGTTSNPTTTAGRFIETSTGGYLSSGGAWTDMSDRDSKQNFQEVDRKELLSRLLSLPITRWSYKAEGCEVEHLGPTAQDFSAAFGLGNDNRSISSLDSSGVALGAIQALYDEVQELRKRVAELEAAKN